VNGIIIVECLFPLQRLDVLDSGQRLSDQKQFDTIFRNSESLHPLCNFSFALFDIHIIAAVPVDTPEVRNKGPNIDVFHKGLAFIEDRSIPV